MSVYKNSDRDEITAGEDLEAGQFVQTDGTAGNTNPAGATINSIDNGDDGAIVVAGFADVRCEDGGLSKWDEFEVTATGGIQALSAGTVKGYVLEDGVAPSGGNHKKIKVFIYAAR